MRDYRPLCNNTNVEVRTLVRQEQCMILCTFADLGVDAISRKPPVGFWRFHLDCGGGYVSTVPGLWTPFLLPSCPSLPGPGRPQKAARNSPFRAPLRASKHLIAVAIYPPPTPKHPTKPPISFRTTLSIQLHNHTFGPPSATPTPPERTDPSGDLQDTTSAHGDCDQRHGALSKLNAVGPLRSRIAAANHGVSGKMLGSRCGFPIPR